MEIDQASEDIINSEKTEKPRTETAFKFNPLLPSFHADPYPTYDRLRSTEPIHRNLLDAWVLTRYADCKLILRDRRFAVDNLASRLKEKSQYCKEPKDFATLATVMDKWLIYLNPPDHTKLRKLVSKAFSPAVVESLRPYSQAIVDSLLDKVINTGTIDIISDLASPLPVTVIAKMLGVPDSDRHLLKQWSDDLSRILDPLLPLETYSHLNQVTMEFVEYFRGLIAEREKKPQFDLTSTLIAAREQGESLSEEEMLSTCILLFLAGEETTVSSIGNGVLALLNHPEQLEKLKQEPAMIQSAVEEILRYESPIQYAQRIATENVEIEGKTIKAGDKVIACIGAANRDPDQFSAPERFDITRRENSHLAFIDGIHACLGATLARLNSQIAINTVVQRLPNIKLNTDKMEWRSNIAIRGLKRLPVSFTVE